MVSPSKNIIYLATDEGNEKVDMAAYSIGDKNYFMLRDIGSLMDFKIDWNSETREISISSNETSGINQSEKVPAAEQIMAVPCNQTISVDGVKYEGLIAYNIDGYTYFQLRDIAKLVDFLCVWDGQTNTVRLDNRYGYEEYFTKTEVPATLSNLAYDFLAEEIPQRKVIEENMVMYITSSQNYNEIERYFKENIDADFSFDDFIVIQDGHAMGYEYNGDSYMIQRIRHTLFCRGLYGN